MKQLSELLIGEPVPVVPCKHGHGQSHLHLLARRAALMQDLVTLYPAVSRRPGAMGQVVAELGVPAVEVGGTRPEENALD